MKDLMFGLLRLQTEKTDEEIRESLFEGEGDDAKLKDDALETLKSWDIERVAKLKPNEEAVKKLTGEAFDKGFQKAQGQLMTDFEKSVKERFNISADAKGLDLIDEIVDISSFKGGDSCICWFLF